jgi:hypothetical protein
LFTPDPKIGRELTSVRELDFKEESEHFNFMELLEEEGFRRSGRQEELLLGDIFISG